MINGKASVTLNLANIRCDVCDFLWPRAHAKTSSTRDPSRGVARALARSPHSGYKKSTHLFIFLFLSV